MGATNDVQLKWVLKCSKRFQYETSVPRTKEDLVGNIDWYTPLARVAPESWLLTQESWAPSCKGNRPLNHQFERTLALWVYGSNWELLEIPRVFMQNFLKISETFSKCMHTISKCMHTSSKCMHTFNKCMHTFSKWLQHLGNVYTIVNLWIFLKTVFTLACSMQWRAWQLWHQLCFQSLKHVIGFRVLGNWENV